MSPTALVAQFPEPLAAAIGQFPQIMVFDFGRYLVAAPVMLAIVWLLGKTPWVYRRIQSRRAGSVDYAREFLASLRTCLVFSVTGIGVGFGVNIGLLQEVELSLGLWRDLAVFAAIVVVHDAYFYWTHRMMHHPRLFRRFHRLHHRSITPTPLAAYAFNLPEAFVMAGFIPLWLVFVPTPVTVIFAFLTFMIVRNVMGHAGLELHARWWLKTPLTRWINTTTHHDLHHSGNFNRNYGLYFTWWDRLCGTEHPDYAGRFEQVVARPGTAKPVLATFV